MKAIYELVRGLVSFLVTLPYLVIKAKKLLFCELVNLPYDTYVDLFVARHLPKMGTRVRLERNYSSTTLEVAVMYDRTSRLTGKTESYNLGYIPYPYSPIIAEMLRWDLGRVLKVRIWDYTFGDNYDEADIRDEDDYNFEFYSWNKPGWEDDPPEVPGFGIMIEF